MFMKSLRRRVKRLRRIIGSADELHGDMDRGQYYELESSPCMVVPYRISDFTISCLGPAMNANEISVLFGAIASVLDRHENVNLSLLFDVNQDGQRIINRVADSYGLRSFVRYRIDEPFAEDDNLLSIVLPSEALGSYYVVEPGRFMSGLDELSNLIVDAIESEGNDGSR